jgi:mono/diheme cytochrome c family protein
MRSGWIVFGVLCLVMLGGWRLLADDKPKATAEGKADPAQIKRGEYLVNTIARCGDCHTPRDDKGEPIMAKHLQGAKMWFTPTIKFQKWEGEAPDITMSGKGGSWSEEVLVKYLSTGLTAKGKKADAPMPAYTMAPEDAKAVTAYLRSLPGKK